MYDYLKKLFEEGALTFDQFVEKLNATKDISIVNLKDGGYVSKDKFDAKVTELTGVKKQLDDANATIQSYKDMDIDGIKKSATDWEEKYNTETAALQKKLDDQAVEFAAKSYLGGFQYADDLVKEAIYAKFMAKNFKLGEDGKFEGADAFMDELKTTYPTSFAAPAGNPPAGNPPAGGSNGGTPAGGAQGNGSGTPAKPRPWFAPQTAPQFKGEKPRTLSEMMEYKNAHPEAKIDFE